MDNGRQSTRKTIDKRFRKATTIAFQSGDTALLGTLKNLQCATSVGAFSTLLKQLIVLGVDVYVDGLPPKFRRRYDELQAAEGAS
jgi:hypothetical protein